MGYWLTEEKKSLDYMLEDTSLVIIITVIFQSSVLDSNTTKFESQICHLQIV